MAVEKKQGLTTEKALQYLTVFLLAILVIGLYTGQLQPQTVVKIVERERPTPIVQQPQVVVQQPPAPVEYVDFAKLVVFAMDEQGNPISQGTVELWRVSNESEVLGRAFYATTGYNVWMSANLTDLGYAEFTISRVQWDVIQKLMEQGIKVYAVVIPTGNYYRGGTEVQNISFIKGKETTSVTVVLQKIASLLYQYDVLVDMRGLQAGDERTWEDVILKVSVNEEGVLKVYKFEIVPGNALSNLTAFIDTLSVTIGGETVTLIEGGSVKLTSTQTVTVPVIELRAGESLSIQINYRLSNAPDPTLDNAQMFVINVYDVRDTLVATSTVTVDTA